MNSTAWIALVMLLVLLVVLFICVWKWGTKKYTIYLKNGQVFKAERKWYYAPEEPAGYRHYTKLETIQRSFNRGQDLPVLGKKQHLSIPGTSVLYRVVGPEDKKIASK